MNPSDTPTNADAPAQPQVPEVDATLPVVNAIVATAVAAAGKRGSAGDVAHGLIAGLRHLRAAVDEEAGYAMAAAIDQAIRSSLLAGNLERLRLTGSTPVPVPLPDPGPGATAAAIIVSSATDSCLAVNAHADDNGPLEHAVFALTSQLVSQLGGAPDWPALEKELHRPYDLNGPVAAAVLPVRGVTVH